MQLNKFARCRGEKKSKGQKEVGEVNIDVGCRGARAKKVRQLEHFVFFRSVDVFSL